MDLRDSESESSIDSEKSESIKRREIRNPVVSDAAAMWHLVQDCGVLDKNSCYAYLLVCRDFADTSLVSYAEGNLQGFVSAYIPPNHAEALFVWQIGIAQSARRQGLAKELLRNLMQLCIARQIPYLEATVTPSNTASAGLFQSIATEFEASFQELPGFKATDFGSKEDSKAAHEPEHLIRIELPLEKK